MNNTVKTGIDILEEMNFTPLKGKKIGVVVNQASINRNLRYTLDILLEGQKGFEVKKIFGPQHGLWGTDQANMIEWEGDGQGLDSKGTDKESNKKSINIPVYSLYGKNRKPTLENLAGLDAMLVDLQDVGARYYTYIWTAKLVMTACAEKGIEMILLDRPNPLGGSDIEGEILDRNHRSFVGLYEIPIRHGMTMGEILLMINKEENIGCSLNIIKMSAWQRNMFFKDTGLPWVLPSPNMPTPETALLYPGFCLLEATNISEGRGTCRPFELCGAPFIDSLKISHIMNKENLPGVYFRPTSFKPTFDKYKDEICGGFQMHITDPHSLRSVETAVTFFYWVNRLYPKKFAFNPPPYEYEYHKLPIDILWGNPSLREFLEKVKKIKSEVLSVEEEPPPYRCQKKK